MVGKSRWPQGVIPAPMQNLMAKKLVLQGKACVMAGRLNEALSACQEALIFCPDMPEALGLKGEILRAQGDVNGAIFYLKKACKALPEDAELWNNLGVAYIEAGKLNEANQALGKAVQINPRLDIAWANLGNSLRKEGRLVDAEHSCLKALEVNPAAPQAMINLGAVWLTQERFPQALALLEKARELAPDNISALTNLGNILREYRKLDEAIAIHKRAVALAPGNPSILNNLAVSLDEAGFRQEAIQLYRQALKLEPNHVAAHGNLGMALLAQGEISKGFKEYEWRWQRPDHPKRELPGPQWQGENLRGKTIFIHAEQCLGDTLQFVRYVPLLAEMGANVVLECQPLLKEFLYRVDGLAVLIKKGEEIPPFDFHCPLMSIPLGFNLNTVPANIPYLRPNPWLVKDWQVMLDGISNLKVGLCWQGNPKFMGVDWRSPGLLLLEILRGIEGVKFFCLQKGGRETFLEYLPQGFDLGREIDTRNPPFSETAAAIMNLDLVISCDTSVLHLAGGLGIKTWALLPHPAEWRWQEGVEYSPWYPNIRLFRQPSMGDWQKPLARLKQELNKLKGEYS